MSQPMYLIVHHLYVIQLMSTTSNDIHCSHLSSIKSTDDRHIDLHNQPIVNRW